MMLYEFRAAVVAVLRDKLSTPLWDIIPDDVAELPCIVVARPSASQTTTSVIFDTTVDVVLVGRRQMAGGNESELITLADDVWTTLGGTRAVTETASEYVIGVTRLEPRVITVAGLECPAYVIAVESSIVTC